jgi:hypothetical protein
MPLGIAFWRDFFYLLTIKAFGVKPILHLDNQGIAQNCKRFLYQKMYPVAFKNCSIIHVNEWLLKKEFAALSVKNAKLYFVNNTIAPQVEVERTENHDCKQILFSRDLFQKRALIY